MAIVGVICEYNPFHKGHQKQFDLIRQEYGEETAIVCLMSGNYVQRGSPALFDRQIRTRAALNCGADLVLELPVTGSLSSAEGFARAGVSILSGLCDRLCFGSETADPEALTQCAEALLRPQFPEQLRLALAGGISFPAARVKALEAMGLSGAPLEKPNDILGVEYCKAILELGSSLKPYPIFRQGSYHDCCPDPENPSATSLRALAEQNRDYFSYIPAPAAECFRSAPVHTLHSGERAILYRLRTMEDREFEALPYGSEGLWRRFMKASRQEASLEDILNRVKTKRYTRARLNRMALCAFLGITAADLASPAPYARILGFDEVGRTLLRGNDFCKNLGRKDDSHYARLESRCNALYGLFGREQIARADQADDQRLIYIHR